MIVTGFARKLVTMGHLGSLGICHGHNHFLGRHQRSQNCIARSSNFHDTGVSPSQPADLVDWPDGRRPNSGRATRSALTKLKVENLRSELSKRKIAALGRKKQDLVEALFAAVQEEWMGLMSIQERKPSIGDIGAASAKECQEDKPSTSGDSHQTPSGVGDIAYIQGHPETIQWVKVMDGSANEIPFGGIEKLPDNFDNAAKWEFLLANKAGIQLIFLGTSPGSASPYQALPSMVLRTQADNWLFDVGEDTQRQILRHPAIKPSKITRLFVTSLSPDVIHGLPGMICTVSSSREQGHKSADTPVHVYGPSGLAGFIDTMFDLSQTYLEIPLIIHEFTNAPVPDGFQLDTLTGARWGLWRSLIPPDALNPRGWYNAELGSVKPIERQARKRTGKRFRANLVNSRSLFRSLNLPKPGDPSREKLLMSEAKWTLKINEQFKVVAIPLKSKIPSVAYFIQEADRAGSLDVERAKQLGVLDSKMYGRLKEGTHVENIHGKKVAPEMAVSPDWKGRNILVVGKSRYPAETLKKPLIDKLDNLILPVTHKPSSMERDMLVHEEVLELSQDLQPETVLFNQIEISDEEHMKLDGNFRGSNSKVAGDLYTHIVEAHQPPPVPPVNDQQLRDLGF